MSVAAAFFDMDRTLVRVNTGTLYMRWRWERGEASARDVFRFMRWIARYSIGVLDPEDITRRAVSTLAGVDEARFREEMRGWYRERVREHIAPDAVREVETRRREGAELVVLTASTPYAAEPLAEELGIPHVLASELDVDAEGKFTGTCGQLCYGPAKVPAARTWAEARGIDLRDCVFYTDSISDLAMLEAVGEPRVVNPDVRLRQVAWRRGWPIDRW